METMARPTKEKRERKEAFIRLRVTADEKRRLVRAAQRAGLGVSTWLRVVGLQACEKVEQVR